jgi:hypothetical protein
MTDLATRRADTLSRIDEAERGQGAALLDGKEADGSTLLALHGELTVIEAAEREATRRAREAEEAEAGAARVEAAKKAALHLSAFCAALAAVESHSQALAAESRKAMLAADGLRRTAPAIGARVPMGVELQSGLAKGLSHVVGVELAGIDQQRAFGHFHWPGPMLRPDLPGALTAAFQPIIEELTA